MIINTKNTKEEVLKAYAYLILMDMIPNDKDQWELDENVFKRSIELDVGSIFEKGRCLVEFGDLGGTNVYLNHDREKIKSLKGLPKKCNSLTIEYLQIDKIDFLPKCEEYQFSECNIKEINYPFPRYVYKLDLSCNPFQKFDNFPEAVRSLTLYGNCFKSSKGMPEITDSLYLANNPYLTELDHLKGLYETVEISDIPELESLPIFSSYLRKLTIEDCPKLENISTLLQLDMQTEVVIMNCENIDYYTLCQIEPIVTCNSTNYLIFKEAFDRIGKEKAVEMGRLEFEKMLKEIYVNSNEVLWEKIPYKTEELKTQVKNFENSSKSIETFNL